MKGNKNININKGLFDGNFNEQNFTKQSDGLAILFSSALGLAGCETTGGNNAATKGSMGAAAGAVVGSIIGNNTSDGTTNLGHSLEQ